MNMSNLSDIVIENVFSVSTTILERGSRGNMTNRKGYGLAMALKGKTGYFLDGKEHILDEKHILFFPQGRSYPSYCYESGRFPLINFYCTDAFFEPGFISFDNDDTAGYYEIFSRMRQLFAFGMPSRRPQLIALMYEFIDKLLQSTQSAYKPAPLLKATEYINANYTLPSLSVERIAGHAGVSETYLRRLFKNNYQKGPRQYLIAYRIARAKQHITESHLPIEVIADKTGFSDVYHFSKTFKRITGYTPSDFRTAFTEKEL